MRALAVGFVCCVVFAIEPIQADEGFVSIFNGKSLEGWVGQDMSFWTIEDDAITGTIRPDHRPPMNQYLVWQGGLVEDFELKLEYRHTGSTTPDTNGGFQYRSRRLPNGDVAGYQVDNNFGQPWKARLYDEFGRHDLALEGQEATLTPAGERQVKPLKLESGAGDFQLSDWHEYHLSAMGRELVLKVNGKTIAIAHDLDDDSFEARGILAMQLHTGPTMKAQFRNIRLKRTHTAADDSREAIIARASLHWDLGDRANAHQPPLAAVGQVDLHRHENASFARLKDGHFHAQVDLNTPKAWNVPGSAMTIHARGAVDPSAGDVILWSKGNSVDKRSVHVSILARDNARVLAVDLRTSGGLVHVEGDAGGAGGVHDWVVRYDGESVELFTDGRSVGKKPVTGTIVLNESPIMIGAASDGEKVTGSFTGDLYELSIWNEALSQAHEAKLLER